MAGKKERRRSGQFGNCLGTIQARYRGPDGVLRAASGTFVRKRDAEIWLTRAEADMHRGLWFDPSAGDVPFLEYAEVWISERPKLRPRTVTLYRSLLVLHLAPTFGSSPLATITYAKVREWRSARLAAGVGEVTLAKAYRLLQAIMNTAVEDELVRRNPCRIKGAGVERSPERPVASIDQVYAIAEEIQPRYRALVLLATFASLRWGELLALRRSDLDLDELTVGVSKAVVEDRGRLSLGSTKSYAGARIVSIPSVVVPDIRSHLEWFAEPGPSGRVFVGPKGATPRRANFNRIWQNAVKAAEVEGLRLHDLRHTGNTLAAMTGATLRELMERAGHSSSRAALGYLHAVKDRDRAIADGLSALVRSSRRVSGRQTGPTRREPQGT